MMVSLPTAQGITLLAIAITWALTTIIYAVSTRRLKKTLDKARFDLRSLKENNSRLAEHVEVYKEGNDILQKKEESLRNDFQQRNDQLCADIALKMQRIDELRTQVDTLTAQNTAMQTEISSHASSTESLKAEIETLKKQNEDDAKDIEELTQQVMLTEKDLNTLRFGLGDLLNKITKNTEHNRPSVSQKSLGHSGKPSFTGT